MFCNILETPKSSAADLMYSILCMLAFFHFGESWLFCTLVSEFLKHTWASMPHVPTDPEVQASSFLNSPYPVLYYISPVSC